MIRGILDRLSPVKTVRAVRQARIFMTFAQVSGLVFMGSRDVGDDENTVRGFTVSTGARDHNVALGSVAGHDVAVVRRSVSHAAMPHERRGHDHTWLIGAVFPGGTELPDVLALSHDHKRLIEEASHVHRHHERHVSVDPRIDGTFLLYAGSGDEDRLRSLFGDDVVGVMTRNPGYDYEFTTDALYVYDLTDDVSPARLNALLKTTIYLAEAVAANGLERP